MTETLDRRLVTEAALLARLGPQSARLALLEALTEFDGDPLDLQAEVVTGMISDPAGPVGKALTLFYGPGNGKRPVGKGELTINAKDYGAVGDGTADDTAALNAAAKAALAAGPNAVLYLPAGTYRITGPVSVSCALDAAQATLNYYGAGTALILGVDKPGVVTTRQRFAAPRVVNKTRVTGWDGSSCGIKVVNLNTCDLYIPFVQDFEQGLNLYGNAAGCAYNSVYLGALWENHKNLVISCTPDGYSNQHQFFGGRLQHSTTKGAVLNDPDASQIYMVSENGEGGPNNNLFLNTSIEGENVAYYRVDVAGRYNQFINCRWESPAGVAPRIRYRASATGNHIEGGYNASSIEETFDGTLGGGSIKDAYGSYMSVNANTPAQVFPNNVWQPITSWGDPVSRRCGYNPGTGEFMPRPGRWQITATVTFAPNAAGRRCASISCAGSTADIAETSGSAGRTSMKLAAVFRFNGKQTFTVNAFQTSGGELALEGTKPYVKVTAEYLGT